MSTSTPSACFRSHEHIRRREDFQRVYNQGRRISGRYGTFFLLSNGLPAGRLGIAATRKFGPAVSRNRAKRLIRDVFRRNKIAPGFDLVVIPKRSLLEAGLSAFEAEFCRLLERRSSR